MNRFSLLIILFCSTLTQAQLNDEFNYADFSTSTWTFLNSGDPLYYEGLEIDAELIQGTALGAPNGTLVFTCGLTYWFSITTGPLIYQEITGDFDVHAAVAARDRDNLANPPDGDFNSVGLLCRNPDDSPGQNYVMVNLGRQSGTIASESKNTINSTSALFLRADLNEGLVRLRRIGDTIRTYKRTGADLDWVILDEFLRPDLPATLQVGICGNGYPPISDIWGEVDYVRWTVEDCETPTGLNAVVGGGIVDISWEAVPGADAYQLQGRPVGTAPWGRVNVLGSNSYDVPNPLLACGTDYEYRIRARCPGANNPSSSFSAISTFMSAACFSPE